MWDNHVWEMDSSSLLNETMPLKTAIISISPQGYKKQKTMEKKQI